MFLCGNLLLLLARGWLVHFCRWDTDIKAGEQKMIYYFIVSIPAACALAAAQGSVVWIHLQAHITNPTGLGLKVSSKLMSPFSLRKDPSLCLVLLSPCSCSTELSPGKLLSTLVGIAPSSSHSLDSVKGVGCTTI